MRNSFRNKIDLNLVFEMLLVATRYKLAIKTRASLSKYNTKKKKINFAYVNLLIR